MKKIKPKSYWNAYYENVKKGRNVKLKKVGRPVKICLSCKLPILGNKLYRANVHTTGIPGIRSDCQIIRDSAYKKEYALNNHSKKKMESYKKPVGLHQLLKNEAKRLCLKCDNSFLSKSPYNRICEGCERKQPDVMNFKRINMDNASYHDFVECGV